MKKSTQAALFSLISLVSISAVGLSQEPTQEPVQKPKTTQKWVSTTYHYENGKWSTTVNCAPTGTNCPLPDPQVPN